MICSNFKGHTLGHMDDTTNFTKAQALDEALGFGTDLMGRFSLNMATDEIAQVMNRAVDHRIDAMSEDLFMLEMERIVDEWEAGELSLSEATHDLMRLLYDRYPHEAQEHLRDVNPELYEEQEEAEGVKRMDALAEDRCTTHDL
jgi:hypothetical protein